MAQQSKEQGKEASQQEKGKEVQKAGGAPMRALSPFEDMDRMMDRMFQGFFPRGWMRPAGWEWPAEMAGFEARAPKVDVIDREGELCVRAEVPGVQKDDLDVSITDSTVTIKGTTQSESEQEEGDFYRRELSRGSFSRTLTLPAEVDGQKAKASFKDGILELILPKIERARRHRLPIE